jgi:hypothetical protein
MDDETSQERFIREQAVFEALYRLTYALPVLVHAVRNTRSRGQSPLPWLVSALASWQEEPQAADEAAKSEKRRLRDFVRWRLVTGLRRAGVAPEKALDLACELLTGSERARSTIKNSFWLVENDLKEKGTASEFNHLRVAQTQGLGQTGVMRTGEPPELQPLDLHLDEALVSRLLRDLY